MAPESGQVYFALVEGAEPRRVIVVSRGEFNRGRYALVVPLTSQRFEMRSHLPNCVPIRAGEFGCSEDCVAQAEAMTLVEHSDLDLVRGPLATLDSDHMRDLIRAIGYVICADCEPC